jgi:protein tyrosine/serine phosphatase
MSWRSPRVGYKEQHFDLSRPEGWAAARKDYFWNDHAFFRVRFQNAHQISPRMWRSNQPSPEQLEAWHRAGIRTVFNLRGDVPASFTAMEKATCERLGMTCHFLKIESRGAPDPVLLKEAFTLFQSCQYPALMHCKSGADRAGLMSVFYLYLVEGVPLDEARKQLSWNYLHAAAGRTGILDFFWDEFARAHTASGVDFWTWLDRDYDRADLRARFRPQPAMAWFVDNVLRRE